MIKTIVRLKPQKLIASCILLMMATMMMLFAQPNKAMAMGLDCIPSEGININQIANSTTQLTIETPPLNSQAFMSCMVTDLTNRSIALLNISDSKMLVNVYDSRYASNIDVAAYGFIEPNQWTFLDTHALVPELNGEILFEILTSG